MATLPTRTLKRVLSIAGKYSGIGTAVSNKALTSNVATLTSTSHGLVAGDRVLVVGVDDTFDGYHEVVSAPTAHTFTYAKTAGNVASAPVSPTGAVSKRLAGGYKRFEDAENLEGLVAALSPSQAFFSAWLSGQDGLFDDGGSFAIKAEILMAVPKDVSNLMVTEWDYVLGLMAQLRAPANYGDGEFPPNGCPCRLHKVEVLDTLGIAIFDLGAYTGNGLLFSDP